MVLRQFFILFVHVYVHVFMFSCTCVCRNGGSLVFCFQPFGLRLYWVQFFPSQIIRFSISFSDSKSVLLWRNEASAHIFEFRSKKFYDRKKHVQFQNYIFTEEGRMMYRWSLKRPRRRRGACSRSPSARSRSTSGAARSAATRASGPPRRCPAFFFMASFGIKPSFFSKKMCFGG